MIHSGTEQTPETSVINVSLWGDISGTEANVIQGILYIVCVQKVNNHDRSYLEQSSMPPNQALGPGTRDTNRR